MIESYQCEYPFHQFLYDMRHVLIKGVSTLLHTFFTHEGYKQVTTDKIAASTTIPAIQNDTIDVNKQAEQLLSNYGNSILRLSYSYLHNMSDAEDVLQDTLIQYIKTAPVLGSKEHEKAWCLRVAINLSKNKIQYNKLRTTDELSEELAASQEEDLAFVWDGVKELPDKYREVIHLFYHEGYSTAQISKLLNQNEATVRSNLHRGRARLKEILKEVYDFEE